MNPLEEPTDSTSDRWCLWRKKKLEAKYYISAELNNRLMKHMCYLVVLPKKCRRNCMNFTKRSQLHEKKFDVAEKATESKIKSRSENF